MTARALLSIAGNNLLRMKLRTSLSVAGVVIAVGAFVARLSFGAGNQQLIAEQYDRFGLFFTMQVYPARDHDTSQVRLLDDQALEELASIPGVRFAYPLEAFDVEMRLGDSVTRTQAQGVSPRARSTPMLSRLQAGRPLTGDSSREAMVTMSVLKDLGIRDADSAIGRPIELTIRLARLDSALVRVFQNRGGELRERFRNIRYDSLAYRTYLTRAVKSELGAALERFLDGLMNGRAVVTETLTIIGVLESSRVGRRSIEPVIISQALARELTAGGISTDPADLFAAMSQGRLPAGFGEDDERQYSRVTLHLKRDAPYAPIKDSVTALGFRSFSYAEQFDEIRQFFLYFDLALGLIGMIALLTASLGIANTLIMAIMERRREIGVLKSLGADDRDIRLLFLFESGTIGAVGAVLGIGLGWLVSRLGSLIAQTVMENKGVEPVDFFAVPLWLIGAALIIGTAVSIIAGLYPAARAARIDPVSALRSE